MASSSTTTGDSNKVVQFSSPEKITDEERARRLSKTVYLQTVEQTVGGILETGRSH